MEPVQKEKDTSIPLIDILITKCLRPGPRRKLFKHVKVGHTTVVRSHSNVDKHTNVPYKAKAAFSSCLPRNAMVLEMLLSMRKKRAITCMQQPVQVSYSTFIQGTYKSLMTAYF